MWTSLTGWNYQWILLPNVLWGQWESEEEDKQKVMIKDAGAPYALTCLRCPPHIWQRNCIVYIQQHQHQCGRLCLAQEDWSVSTDLISLWYLGLHVCPPCWWEKFFPFMELRHFPTCCPEITEIRTTVPVYRTSIPYRQLSTQIKPAYRYKPTALITTNHTKLWNWVLNHNSIKKKKKESLILGLIFFF